MKLVASLARGPLLVAATLSVLAIGGGAPARADTYPIDNSGDQFPTLAFLELEAQSGQDNWQTLFLLALLLDHQNQGGGIKPNVSDPIATPFTAADTSGGTQTAPFSPH